jgi:predicted HAD superfamily Cof-like phosphohydrolase
MDNNWFEDIENMHRKFQTHDWMTKKLLEEDFSTIEKYLHFRLNMCQEELNETKEAVMNKNAEEVVDGLIDLCVFAIGTLEIFGVNANLAWKEVFKANMKKKVGEKVSRKNEFEFPDLIKDEDWTPPSHKNNHGILDIILKRTVDNSK